MACPMILQDSTGHAILIFFIGKASKKTYTYCALAAPLLDLFP